MPETELELNEEVAGYIRVPYSYYKRNNGCRSKILLLSTVFTFSNAQNATCNSSFTTFGERLRLSRSTVARGIKALKISGEITQDKSRRSCAAYSDAQRTKERGFVKVELFLYFTLFSVRGEDKPRYLTNAEIDVLSLIKTHCANKENSGKFVGSVRGIAKTLNLNKNTVQDALSVLLRAGLIYRPGDYRGVNGNKRSTYTVNAKLLRRSERNYKKKTAPTSAPKEKALSAEERAADARSARESYYSERRNRAIDRAKYFEDKLNQDATYKAIDTAYRAMPMKLAYAEHHHLPNYEALRAQERELETKRRQRMAEFRISEEDLTPRWTCEKCSDTGFLPNGHMCDCYTPPTGGRQS